MATGTQEDLEKQYMTRVRCMWIWFQVTGDLEDLKSFKNHAENYIDKIKYCEYQFQGNAKELCIFGILHWKNRTTPNNTDKLFFNYSYQWGSLLTSADVQVMKKYCRKEEARFIEEERVQIGKDTGIQHYNNQLQAEKKKSQKLEVLEMIRSMGVTEAKINWSAQDGCCEAFKSAKKQYDFQMEAKRDKNMIERARQTQWRGWQKYLVDYLKAPVDPREILVVLDKKGNSGKSFLIKNFKILNEEKTCKIGKGKMKDIMHIISKKPLVENILVDLPRSIHEPVNYEVLEQVKDGEIFSTKYDGREISIDFCRMIIFTNEPLKWESLSRDRWSIMTVKEDGTFKVENYTHYKDMGGD